MILLLILLLSTPRVNQTAVIITTLLRIARGSTNALAIGIVLRDFWLSHSSLLLLGLLMIDYGLSRLIISVIWEMICHGICHLTSVSLSPEALYRRHKINLTLEELLIAQLIPRSRVRVSSVWKMILMIMILQVPTSNIVLNASLIIAPFFSITPNGSTFKWSFHALLIILLFKIVIWNVTLAWGSQVLITNWRCSTTAIWRELMILWRRILAEAWLS